MATGVPYADEGIPEECRHKELPPIPEEGIVRRFIPRKSASDPSSYECAVLDNDLVVMAVSDPKLKRAAAALSLWRGHYSDPAELPGLAHLCEHMLFLGTEKYPEEGEYKRFLAEHGGVNNAATAGEYTVYHFKVSSESFEGALDRFFNFFVSPLFNEEATMRELKAVDSEFQRGRNSDIKRNYQLLKHLSDPNHVFSKFGSGNLKSLHEIPTANGVDLRSGLLSFYNSNYSSNIMRLCLMGPFPTSHLIELAARFRQVANKNLTHKIMWEGRRFPPDRLGKLVQFRPIKNLRLLDLFFPLPFTADSDYRTKSVSYLATALGQEGEGSVASYLQQQKGWITEIVVGEQYIMNNDSLLKIEVRLTDEGAENVASIVGAMFYYIRLLQESGPQEWLWEEIARTHRLGFDFKDEVEPYAYTQSVSLSMQRFGPDDCLPGAQLYWNKLDRERIMEALTALTPDNMLILRSTMNDEDLDLVEPWYETPYSSTPIPQSFLDAIKDAPADPELRKSLYIQKPNPYIPNDLTVLTAHHDMPPCLVHKNWNDEEKPAVRVEGWFRQDKLFPKPKGVIYCQFHSPVSHANVLNEVALRVFIFLLDDSLITKMYPAVDVSYSWGFQITSRGLRIKTSGFSDKLPLVAAEVVDGFFNFALDRARFASMKEKVVTNLKNSLLNNPSTLVTERMGSLMLNPSWTTHQKLAAANALTYENMQAVIEHLKKDMSILVYVHGNFTRKMATDFCVGIEEKAVASKCVSIAEQDFAPRVVELPYPEKQPSEHIHYTKQDNPNSPNCAISVYFQLGKRSTKLTALLHLLVQFFNPRCFSELRTRQQLGYVVSSSPVYYHNTAGFQVVIQSSVKPPAELHRRIDAFVKGFGTELEELDQTHFDGSKHSAIQKVLEPSSSMQEEVSKAAFEIVERLYCWERDKLTAREIERLTKDDLIGFYRNHFWPRDWSVKNARKVVSVYYYNEAMAQEHLSEDVGRRHRTLEEGIDAQIEPIVDISQWKARLPFLPSFIKF